MTLRGVRSSCDASAVNSACRRLICSMGAEARSPTTNDPVKVTMSRSAPSITSTRIRSSEALTDLEDALASH